jgi:hypothetical protein
MDRNSQACATTLQTILWQQEFIPELLLNRRSIIQKVDFAI